MTERRINDEESIRNTTISTITAAENVQVLQQLGTKDVESVGDSKVSSRMVLIRH